MKDWKIIGKTTSHLGSALTLGFVPSSTTWKVQHRTTGEVRKVTAYNEKSLGEKIRRGQFDD